jgi:hypothetical protein
MKAMTSVYDLSAFSEIDRIPWRQRSNFPEITDEEFWDIYAIASRYSIVHVTGFYNIFQSMKYIARNKLPGDIVECGCFLGGVGIFIGILRKKLALEKRIYLFDSFAGPPPGEKDKRLGKEVVSSSYPDILDDVQENVALEIGSTTGFQFIKGYVENTLPTFMSGPLCLLRLDTDFYNSTKVEFEMLYDRLVPGGVIIVDDYGLFSGSRKATDEFISKLERIPLLNRIDRGIWAGVKPART